MHDYRRIYPKIYGKYYSDDFNFTREILKPKYERIQRILRIRAYPLDANYRPVIMDNSIHAMDTIPRSVQVYRTSVTNTQSILRIVVSAPRFENFRRKDE